MTDIVERLRLLVPSDSSGAAFDAVDEITALRAENERLRAALDAICIMDISWVGDAFKLKDRARAALEEKS